MLTILSATPAYRQVVVNGFQWGDNLTEWLAEKTQSFEEQKCVSGNTYLALCAFFMLTDNIPAVSRSSSSQSASQGLDLPRVANVTWWGYEPLPKPT